MPKLLPLILVGGLPRAGKTSFTNRIQSQIDGVEVFSEENDHMPIYVSVYVPEDIRSGNKVLDKYTQSDNEMFIGLNKRPRRTEGFVVMTTREVNEYLKEYNDITSTNKGRSS